MATSFSGGDLTLAKRMTSKKLDAPVATRLSLDCVCKEFSQCSGEMYHNGQRRETFKMLRSSFLLKASSAPQPPFYNAALQMGNAESGKRGGLVE